MMTLTADEGYVYTNGETRGKVVYLGKNDSEANWRMIPEEPTEAEATEADYQDALREMGVVL